MTPLRLGVRGKLFVGSVLIIGVFGLASGLYLERELRGLLETRIELELLRHAQGARELVEASPDSAPAAMELLADRFGAATGARITIIAEDGRVLGDSELTLAGVAALENHAGRTEVRAALARGRGKVRRFSTTVHREMLYIAVPARVLGGRGVVRAGHPLAEVDRTIDRLQIVIGVAGVLGLVLALVVSGFASHLATRSVRDLADRAQALARGAGARALPAGTDELGGLAGSLHRVARRLEESVAALAGERDRLNAILESMREAVLALDAQGCVVLANGAAGALLGASSVELGRPLLEVVRSPELSDLVGRVEAEGTVVHELDLPGPRRRRVLTHGAALRATGGVVLVLHDVTETRRLEAIRRDFVANVSHELRTPVSVIHAHGETLLGGALDDRARARGFVEGIARNAERLSRLIADLLDLSRVEAGELDLAPRAVEIDSIVTRSIEAVAQAARGKNVEITRDLDGVSQVRADDRALEQVFINLLENAVRYTQAGGHVRVTARRLDGAVRLEVRDDGPGIEPRHRDRVFERFYRVDPGRSREMGGTGLGLSIVKHLVQAMGGRVGMEPAEPRGSVFWLTLPGASGG